MKAAKLDKKVIGHALREADRAGRAEDMLREIVDAYIARFHVPGRGLVGPIDAEISRAASWVKRTPRSPE